MLRICDKLDQLTFICLSVALRCYTCHGHGQVQCQECKGAGQLKFYIELKIEW